MLSIKQGTIQCVDQIYTYTYIPMLIHIYTYTNEKMMAIIINNNYLQWDFFIFLFHNFLKCLFFTVSIYLEIHILSL